MLCERNFLPVGMTELFFEKVLNFFVRYHLFIEDVCSGFRRFYHLDNLWAR